MESKLSLPMVKNTLTLSHAEAVKLRSEIDMLINTQESYYLQNTIEYFKSYSIGELKREIQSTFKVLKIKLGLLDLRSFAAIVAVDVPKGYKSGFSSYLYNDKEAMGIFLARILKRYGKPVNDRYTITFPI